ncbi:DUF5683 domain-containing protein [Hymenobacter psychrotolerans]|uniref:DUF5683 domain-containing protein n=1 Tax=Hymenobacter psychrotolerans DSM 18569 TaxID=1121959 RepID=A0A1M6WN61_9BACT|nr:DUF5683 domain-containing protein [Hymenobacter psychrotolerans]SHK95177.1 hypothetical protein SAMN02746009_01850 [Hymenobacter psychrotolerans DSM 18569]
MNRCSRLSTLAAATLLALPLAQQARAQTTDTGVSPTTVTAGPDSARVSTTVVPDSVRRTARLFGLKMTKPSKAGLLAALLPSAGQIYNRRWWKLPLVYGAVGGTLYGELHYQKLYRDFADVYNARTDGDPNTNTEKETTQGRTNDYVKRGVIVYRRQRDSFVAWTALAYTMQILDAVVDAHLRDFDISDDLSLRWEPTLLRMPTAAATPGVGLTLTLK